MPKLRAKGYTVVVIRHDDLDAGIAKVRQKLGLSARISVRTEDAGKGR